MGARRRYQGLDTNAVNIYIACPLREIEKRTMKIEVNELRKIINQERSSPHLQKLEKDFYRELSRDMSELFKDYSKCSDKEFSKKSKLGDELKNLKNIINDIYETRERKIVSNALYYAKSGEGIDPESLTVEEEKVLKEVVKVIKSQRDMVLGKFSEQASREKKEEKKEQKKPVLTVRILKDLPPIVGVDGVTYGAFKEEDVVILPEPNAKGFIKQKVAEKIVSR